MFGGDAVGRLVIGVQAIGGGAGMYAAFKLVQFLFNFIAGRSDARQDRLDKREERVDASYASRLEHLERADVQKQQRIAVLEEAVNILAAELRQHDPSNAKLSEVAKLLRGSIPPPLGTPDDMIDQLRRMP